MSNDPAVRLAHFSDVHVTARPLGWRRRDWLTKRTTGWMNFRWLGRGSRFRQADQVAAALAADLRHGRPDRVIFSGDATALGFEAEFVRAAALLGVGGANALPGLAVPGNHDYYTRAVAAAGLFERYFAPWQTGERVDTATYPFAQRVGPLWLVAVNSSTGNFWTWDAGGRVDAAQLDRLRQLLARLEPGPRILVTHYPVVLASGRRERRSHGLRNLAHIVAVAAEGGVCLWLHGHRHGPYYHAHPALAPFPVVCAGSATQRDLWAYGDYTIRGRHFHATRRVFSPRTGAFENGDEFELELPAERTSGAQRTQAEDKTERTKEE
jgi:3',5'-cyclic AMP phosphodiesterase CpdA